ncbi:hypothetical protein [Mycobacterium sp.]|uniref:hypothetical protein n=1 Tax=Mycobacterium sp. TaxID=1785 RepID=UPI0025E31AA9|nr:hypothetical protein [Mycobacterium sp.]
MRRMTLVSALSLWTLGVAVEGPALASPTAFPDVDARHPVVAADYRVQGAHPSSSGWAFSTPGGQRCQDSMIAELGVMCWGPMQGAPAGSNTISVSLTKQGTLDRTTTEIDAQPISYPTLPVGSKLATDNGVVCAVLTTDSFACRASRPATWAADTPDPPDRHYAEHGFVVAPQGSWTY